MRKTITFPTLALAIFLFCWINLPKQFADRVRALAVSIFRSSSTPPSSTDLSRLQLENQVLRTHMDHAYEWGSFQQKTGEQWKAFCQKRADHLRNLLEEQLLAVPAQVIYRDPSSWSSSLWVNVGEDSNRALGRLVIAKNSPVLADGALVGVVDYVGKKQSRIRLITDSGLCPSVRVCRGATHNREIARQAQALFNQVEKRDDLFAAKSDKEQLMAHLRTLQERSGSPWEDGYLAKGELHGSSAPFWRSRGPILKGIGFNFAYPDPHSTTTSAKAPILKEGDLLVTSGLDGVFPQGLRVGTVLSIEPSREGSYAQNIEVCPAVTHLNDLQTLLILPPVGE